MTKRYILAHQFEKVKTPGKKKTPTEDAVEPKYETLSVGTVVKKSDFEADEFKELVTRGTILEQDTEDDDAEDRARADAASRDAKHREELFKRAKKAKLTGIKDTIATDELESLVVTEENKRPDGSTPSTQQGAGRADPSRGSVQTDAGTTAPAGTQKPAGADNSDLTG